MEPNTVEQAFGQSLIEQRKDQRRKILGRRGDSNEVVGIEVQILVVEARHDLVFRHFLDLREIDHHASRFIGFTLYRNFQPIVVPMTIGSATETLPVLLLAQILQPVAERSREMNEC